MDKEALLQRKDAIEKQFNNVQDEAKRLQGEYRLVVELLEKYGRQSHEVKKPTKRLRKVEVENAKN